MKHSPPTTLRLTMPFLESPRLWLACLAAVFAGPPAIAQITPLPATLSAPKVEQFTLANGLTVIVKPDRRAPTAAHMLWVRVGSMDEVDGTSGVAHVLEHMLFKGTAEVKPGEFFHAAWPHWAGATTLSPAVMPPATTSKSLPASLKP